MNVGLLNSDLWRRLGKTLRELRIFECRIPAGGVYLILEDCPSSEALEIRDGKSSDIIFDNDDNNGE